MAESKSKSMERLSDLPNFRAGFHDSLGALGIGSIDDLREVLMDDARSASLVKDVSGLGPKIVESWRKAVLSSPRPAETSEPSDASEQLSAGERPDIGTGPDAEQASGDALNVPVSEGERTIPPRGLYCTIDDMHEVKQTLMDLLQWDGGKRKGLSSTIKYVVRKLKDAGLTVSMVEDDEGDPLVVIGEKGAGGLVLWGHLDTGGVGGMEGAMQGVVALDFVYGRGAVDMKGALAVLLCAVKKMSAWEAPFTVVLTADGVSEQEGARCMAESHLIRKSRGVLMLAPTDMCPAYGQAGRLDLNVTIFGEDSIMVTSAFLDSLGQSDSLLPGQQWLRVGLIRGGKRREPFGTASSCQTSFTILTSYQTSEAAGLVEDLLRNYDHLTEVMRRSEPLELDPGSKLVKEIEEIVGREPKLLDISTEASYLWPSVSDICICGPGNPSRSGSSNESVVLTDLEETYEMILALVDRSES
jgi:acetylornithine deacetylase/succinyl-diaminopimelate desuccinylase-like protein